MITAEGLGAPFVIATFGITVMFLVSSTLEPTNITNDTDDED
jgi:hypothetical protein